MLVNEWKRTSLINQSEQKSEEKSRKTRKKRNNLSRLHLEGSGRRWLPRRNQAVLMMDDGPLDSCYPVFETPEQEDTEDAGDGRYCGWMTRLPDHVKQKPLSELVIPGSHDSFTSTLIRGSQAGPDQPEIVQQFCRVFPCISKHILYRWSYTQRKDANFQLRHGIRYFDIRLVAEDGKFKILHCLKGQPVRPILESIQGFLRANAGEVVILDFQHLYKFSLQDEKALGTLILSVFKGLICPPCSDLPSLSSLNKRGLQVLVIQSRPLSPMFWSRSRCPNPWPNTRSASELRAFLNGGLATRDPRQLFVSQGVFTPTLGTVVTHLLSNLDQACARRCNATSLNWLQQTRNYN